jgi:hypothetical protein
MKYPDIRRKFGVRDHIYADRSFLNDVISSLYSHEPYQLRFSSVMMSCGKGRGGKKYEVRTLPINY